MGLDTAQILIDIEKRFGILLSQAEVGHVLTVGDLHNIVWQNTTVKQGTRCKSQMVFYRLRTYFIETAGLQRQHFTTGSSLNNMLPANGRRRAYTALSKQLQLQLPGLELTKRWTAFLSVFGLLAIGGGLAASLILIFFLHYSNWYLLVPCTGIALTQLVSILLNAKRTEIEQATAADFVRTTVALNYAILNKQTGANRREVEYVVNQIIHDNSGVEMHEIQPHKKIGDDLGID